MYIPQITLMRKKFPVAPSLNTLLMRTFRCSATFFIGYVNPRFYFSLYNLDTCRCYLYKSSESERTVQTAYGERGMVSGKQVSENRFQRTVSDKRLLENSSSATKLHFVPQFPNLVAAHSPSPTWPPSFDLGPGAKRAPEASCTRLPCIIENRQKSTKI